LVLSLGTALTLQMYPLFGVLVGYIALNSAYNFKLKHLAYIDILCIGLCFMLRILAGSVAIGMPAALWMLLLVFLLAFFLALGKRRDERWRYEHSNIYSRTSIVNYSLKTTDTFLQATALGLILTYGYFSFKPIIALQFGTPNVIYTLPFVALGLMRYLWLLQHQKHFGNPTQMIFKDRILQLMVLGWVTCFYILIYN